MTSKKSHSKRPPFQGCVELHPHQPSAIEFIESDHSWTFPMNQFIYSGLSENPGHRSQKTLPPDELKIRFSVAEVTLKGWRLEQITEALRYGRSFRVHAEKLLGNLILDEPWVSEIHVRKF